jgi:tRNA pseudouridine38-40 synthase
MQQAANDLVGVHDFSSFRAAECQAHSPIKDLKELTIKRYGELLVVQIRADGFLHHMVRNIVGVLLPIGQGRKPVEHARNVLLAKDRSKGDVTAKGDGLYFVNAHYDRTDLPHASAGPLFIQPLIDSDGLEFSPL